MIKLGRREMYNLIDLCIIQAIEVFQHISRTMFLINKIDLSYQFHDS